MNCPKCHANIVEGDRFCQNCGAPLPAGDPGGVLPAVPFVQPTLCPRCHATVPEGNRFCTQCGAAVAGDAAAPDAATSVPVSAAAPASAVSPIAAVPVSRASQVDPQSGRPLAAEPLASASGPMAAEGTLPASEGARADVASAGGGTGTGTGAAAVNGNRNAGFAGGLAVAVVLLVAMFVLGTMSMLSIGPFASHDGTGATSAASASGSSSSSDGSSSQSCGTEPDMKVVSVESVGNDLVVTVLVTSNCPDDAPATLDDADTRITLRDSDGNTVADAIFDFSGGNSQSVTGSGTQIKLSYAPTQFYRPASELADDPSELIIKYVYAAKSGNGSSTYDGPSDQSGTVGGDSTVDDEAEENARKALEWQIKHDKPEAQRFYSTYTTQLSSKLKGVHVEGKTWTYRDILAQYISLKDKHPNTLLIWSGDWPTYDANTTKYYVILSGEGFGTVDAAQSWCDANGYGEEDCLPVNLE
ncbi:zinc ribbon domain-containing protein [Bifidobacterium sp. 82T24]|uniref:zinc ribbon domain-containing protein n=1 Tax=Bifidobacterium pluvialisilvae TaxID=2834436 RepID=UPI001C56F10B|nr:zinc ribbon domain-containing protein [Bifidobacterium pluvialisilvae]MBW3088283.1 zinc ribbon domain-containing protein [Bifidobacterium pluvialisilvae]